MIIREFKEKDKFHLIELSKRFSDINFMNYRDKNLMEKKQEQLAIVAIEKNKSNIFGISVGRFSASEAENRPHV